MGTYDDESPDAGFVEKIKNSVSKVVSDVASLASPAALRSRKSKVDEASGDHSDDYLARARAGQSTDSSNDYQ